MISAVFGLSRKKRREARETLDLKRSYQVIRIYRRWLCKCSVVYVNNVNDDTRKWKINHNCFNCFRLENSSSNAFVLRPASGKETAVARVSMLKRWIKSHYTSFRVWHGHNSTRSVLQQRKRLGTRHFPLIHDVITARFMAYPIRISLLSAVNLEILYDSNFSRIVFWV